MTQEQQDKLRMALYNAKFTTDAEDENPFVGIYFNDLLDIIHDFPYSPPQWIPVEEELPEKENEFEDYSKLVIVTNGKDFWKGMYNYGGEEWLTFDLWPIDDATHWMEIVPPRKEETDD